MIKDSYGRHINYLRLAVTDRCNLRCAYCMPHEGIDWLGREELLSYEEMLRLCKILVKAGIQKIRITGGEPFARRGIMGFLMSLSQIKGLDELSITTNGVLTAPFVPELQRMGIRSVNLSLDTLDRERFMEITRRDELDKVLETLNLLLQYGMEVKMNAVVMADKNIEDIIPLVALTRTNALSVRFIEEMPFNGSGDSFNVPEWDYIRILQKIKEHFPGICKIKDAPHSTSYNYHIPGHKGTVGIIAAYTRSFCGTCNRIRITPQGALKTCLYDNGVLNVRELLRSSVDEDEMANLIMNAISKKSEDGWEAERSRTTGNIIKESMASIGG